ncbi:MAG TPA: aminotransferase class V-fold PLP-dependent enzyme [Methylomirabilota bacterium]|nr:aminotransferase class V-fold PLP-dependent enzyme [Methylomirabilota bacterium]
MSYKEYFRHFLDADPARLHVAAHSHHFWPDATLRAQETCWRDAARLADRKWEQVFGEVVPAAQRHVAHLLNLKDPSSLAFGPNTHGFVLRLLSLLPPGQPVRILTTDSEFHSFTRQVRRLEEEALAEVTRVPAEPTASFSRRFIEAAGRGGHDLVFFSQVFFNSGYAVPDVAALVGAVPDAGTIVAVDGYHGFMALPTDLTAIAGRAFYIAGGYKYAMAGEGACFIHVPADRRYRPRDTGWFASFGTLESEGATTIDYAPGGAGFLGATFDPVGLYRLNAVLGWLESVGITPAMIHAHVHGLQRDFIDRLAGLKLAALHPGQLVVPIAESNRGNFLTFRTPDADRLHRRLLAANIVTDHRGDRLRFGFGLYHDAADIRRLCERLQELLA